MSDLDELDARARTGDQGAASALCEQLLPSLAGLARRYLKDAHAAEDVAQDAVAALLQEQPWPKGAARPWLLRRVRYCCLDLLKRRRLGQDSTGALFPELSLPSPRTGPRTAAERAESREALRARIAALPECQAEVVILRYFEGLSRGQIAELIDVPESTVKARLYDASRRLRASMKETES